MIGVLFFTTDAYSVWKENIVSTALYMAGTIAILAAMARSVTGTLRVVRRKPGNMIAA